MSGLNSDLLYFLAATGIMAAATFFTRVLPFLLFARRKPAKAFLRLQEDLPLFVLLVLLVYSLKDSDWASGTTLLRLALSLGAVLGLHLGTKNALMSIFGATLLNMILINFLP